MKIRPWTMILTMLAGWINQHQQGVIEYLRTENAILKEKIGKKNYSFRRAAKKISGSG